MKELSLTSWINLCYYYILLIIPYINMKISKLDKRFKLYEYGYKYYAETETTDEDTKFFSIWIHFCETQWGTGHSLAKNSRWQYTFKWHHKKNIIESRIFFRNEKDVTWFTLGTST